MNSGGEIVSHSTVTQPIAPVARSATGAGAMNGMLLGELPELRVEGVDDAEMEFDFLMGQGFGGALL